MTQSKRVQVNDPARAARTNAAETENSDDDEADDDENDNRVAHATKPLNKDKKSNVPQYKPKDSTVVKVRLQWQQSIR